MIKQQTAHLQQPARNGCSLGSGMFGYVTDTGFGVWDFWRKKEHIFQMRDAKAIGAVAINVCSGDPFAIAFFAGPKELYAFPLFPACDAPFENARKDQEGYLLPSNAVQLPNDPNTFQPMTLSSTLSSGEIYF